MRGAGIWVVACLVGAAACSTGGTVGNAIGTDAGPTATADAGTDDETPDAADAGPDVADAGTDDADAGTDDADAGTDVPDAGPVGRLTLTTGAELDRPTHFHDGSEGLPNEVLDASRDAAGNLWAVSRSRLFVLRSGMGAFESFGSGDGLKDDDILSVSGGTAGIAWVGYRGLGDSETDPVDWRGTGGAQQVELSGADIRTTTYRLESPPGTFSDYPDGRYKLRSCWRAYGVKTGPLAGEAWFGCNHGVALIGTRFGVEEHHHPGICVTQSNPNACTTKTGDVPAIAFTPDGDRWMGGTYGVMLLDYADANGNTQFWGPEPVRNEHIFPNPEQPNGFGSEDITGLAVAADGSLWAGSRHSGLSHRLSDGTVENYRAVDGLPSNKVEDVAMDEAGGLWIAFAEHGLWRLDTATGELRRASGLPTALAKRVVFEQTDAGPAVVAVVRGGIAVFER